MSEFQSANFERTIQRHVPNSSRRFMHGWYSRRICSGNARRYHADALADSRALEPRGAILTARSCRSRKSSKRTDWNTSVTRQAGARERRGRFERLVELFFSGFSARERLSGTRKAATGGGAAATGQEQRPEVQTWPDAHLVPQVPQWFGLVAKVTQPGPTGPGTGQITFPAGQEHFPSRHSSPRMQVVLQLPQSCETPSIAGAALMFAQTLPGQITFPVGQKQVPEIQE